jgi:hypothetical protein
MGDTATGASFTSNSLPSVPTPEGPPEPINLVKALADAAASRSLQADEVTTIRVLLDASYPPISQESLLQAIPAVKASMDAAIPPPEIQFLKAFPKDTLHTERLGNFIRVRAFIDRQYRYGLFDADPASSRARRFAKHFGAYIRPGLIMAPTTDNDGIASDIHSCVDGDTNPATEKGFYRTANFAPRNLQGAFTSRADVAVQTVRTVICNTKDTLARAIAGEKVLDILVTDYNTFLNDYRPGRFVRPHVDSATLKYVYPKKHVFSAGINAYSFLLNVADLGEQCSLVRSQWEATRQSLIMPTFIDNAAAPINGNIDLGLKAFLTTSNRLGGAEFANIMITQGISGKHTSLLFPMFQHTGVILVLKSLALLCTAPTDMWDVASLTDARLRLGAAISGSGNPPARIMNLLNTQVPHTEIDMPLKLGSKVRRVPGDWDADGVALLKAAIEVTPLNMAAFPTIMRATRGMARMFLDLVTALGAMAPAVFRNALLTWVNSGAFPYSIYSIAASIVNAPESALCHTWDPASTPFNYLDVTPEAGIGGLTAPVHFRPGVYASVGRLRVADDMSMDNALGLIIALVNEAPAACFDSGDLEAHIASVHAMYYRPNPVYIKIINALTSLRRRKGPIPGANVFTVPKEFKKAVDPTSFDDTKYSRSLIILGNNEFALPHVVSVPDPAGGPDIPLGAFFNAFVGANVADALPLISQLPEYEKNLSEGIVDISMLLDLAYKNSVALEVKGYFELDYKEVEHSAYIQTTSPKITLERSSRSLATLFVCKEKFIIPYCTTGVEKDVFSRSRVVSKTRLSSQFLDAIRHDLFTSHLDRVEMLLPRTLDLRIVSLAVGADVPVA